MRRKLNFTQIFVFFDTLGKNYKIPLRSALLFQNCVVTKKFHFQYSLRCKVKSVASYYANIFEEGEEKQLIS